MSDFEFLTGDWVVTNRQLVAPLTGSAEWIEHEATSTGRSVFEGGGNMDEIVFADGRRGMTLRLFDTETKLWSLYWSNSRTGRLYEPIVGAFGEDGVGVFLGEEEHEGRTVSTRYTWSRVGTATPRWQQEWSDDGGVTWEANWVMDFRRP